jgi:hypothetical protein
MLVLASDLLAHRASAGHPIERRIAKGSAISDKTKFDVDTALRYSSHGPEFDR